MVFGVVAVVDGLGIVVVGGGFLNSCLRWSRNCCICLVCSECVVVVGVGVKGSDLLDSCSGDIVFGGVFVGFLNR